MLDEVVLRPGVVLVVGKAVPDFLVARFETDSKGFAERLDVISR